jgi:hypothetical protein
MRLDALSGAQLYMRNRQQCDNLFHQKKMSFCFNHPHNPVAELRNEKFGSSKYFEVHGVQEKEPRINE